MAIERTESAPPLYQQIKRKLRETIARGEYEPGVRFITQREVCERFEVSTATAVRALNELVTEGVLVRQRGRGTFVAEPGDLSQETAPSRDATIAFIVHGHGPHQSELLRGMGSVCTEHGYRLFVSDSTPSDTHEERALQQALDAGASGVVLYPRQGHGPLNLLTELRRQRLPIVVVDRHLTGSPTDAVLADNFADGYQVTDKLIERGHHRIATLWSEYQCTSAYDRATGHVQALRDNDVSVSPDLTVLRSYLDLSEPQRRSFLRSLLDAPEPPTALLCANAFVLATAAHDLLGLDVRIPDDIDLASMDDAGPFDLLPLACVAAVLPSYDMGTTAMRMLIQRIGSDDPYRSPQHRVLPISIRTRESSRAQLRPISTTAQP